MRGAKDGRVGSSGAAVCTRTPVPRAAPSRGDPIRWCDEGRTGGVSIEFVVVILESLITTQGPNYVQIEMRVAPAGS